VIVVSAYFKYNMSTSTLIEKLRPILESDPRVLIDADVNDHSTTWHCPDCNDRGYQIDELISDFSLTVVNRPGQIWTYDI